MSQENTDQNKIEVFVPSEVRLERRRALPASTRAAQVEKPPDLPALWRTIQKRRWTVLTAISILFAIVLVGTLKQKPVYRSWVSNFPPPIDQQKTKPFRTR
jgi:hypothetical protein